MLLLRLSLAACVCACVWVWVMGYGLWVMGYGLWVMGYGLWVVGYGLWVVGCGLWVMGMGVGIGESKSVSVAMSSVGASAYVSVRSSLIVGTMDVPCYRPHWPFGEQSPSPARRMQTSLHSQCLSISNRPQRRQRASSA